MIEHGATEGIPMSVYFQAINFAIFAGLAYYFLRHPIRSFFANRKENFRQALIKAEHAKREAEMRKQEVRERLEKLEITSRQTVAQARAEAESLRERILQDARDLTRNVREEAGRTVDAEIARAKAQLRDELLSQSVLLSKKILSEKISNEPDQQRLQTEFVDKIARNMAASGPGQPAVGAVPTPEVR